MCKSNLDIIEEPKCKVFTWKIKLWFSYLFDNLPDWPQNEKVPLYTSKIYTYWKTRPKTTSSYEFLLQIQTSQNQQDLDTA